MSPRLTRWCAVAAAASLTACANLAPTYERPAAPVPAAWPQPASPGADAGTLGWRGLVQDDRLRGTIELALANSRGLRLAVLAVEQARTAYQIESAAAGPTVTATAAQSAARTPAQTSSSGQVQHSRSFSVGLGATAWEIDLFGRVRNLQDAALETYLATDEARRSTQLALVAEVANAWLALAADQSQLALARQTLDSRRRSLELTRQRRDAGADSGLALAQAQTGVESARRDVAAYEAQVQQDLNALQLLVGAALPPALWPAQQPAGAVAALVAVPAGLPSAVLQQRPDVMAAEHRLKATHADIGAARAALYPRISLTASAGTASRSLGDLFKGGAWSFAPSVSLPIFDGGAAQAGVRSAEVGREIALAGYEQAVQTAFREVADALATRATLAERLDAQRALVDATQRSFDLADARWKAGASSYLEVLDAQRSLLAARQALISLQQVEQANRITLFKVLGGGGADAPALAGTFPTSTTSER